MQRCIRERKENTKKTAGLVSFFAMVALEYLARLPVVEQNDVFYLYPTILTCIKSTSSPDLHIAGYMLATLLAERTALSQEALVELVTTACKSVCSGSARELVQMVAVLVQAGQLESLDRCIAQLVSIDGWSKHCEQVCRQFQVPFFIEAIQNKH